MKPRECPSAAVLPCAVLPCCSPGIQADTALDVSAQAYRQTPRWTAANLPHECTRVRCDVSGSCLSKLCCAPITRCKAGLGAVATDEPRAPPHASVRKINLFQKKSTPRAFRGKVPQKRQAVCLSQRTTPVRFKNDTCPLLCYKKRTGCPWTGCLPR
jgi:hypothetical protein